jgi:hypothetical protein
LTLWENELRTPMAELASPVIRIFSSLLLAMDVLVLFVVFVVFELRTIGGLAAHGIQAQGLVPAQLGVPKSFDRLGLETGLRYLQGPIEGHLRRCFPSPYEG